VLYCVRSQRVASDVRQQSNLRLFLADGRITGPESFQGNQTQQTGRASQQGQDARKWQGNEKPLPVWTAGRGFGETRECPQSLQLGKPRKGQLGAIRQNYRATLMHGRLTGRRNATVSWQGERKYQFPR